MVAMPGNGEMQNSWCMLVLSVFCSLPANPKFTKCLLQSPTIPALKAAMVAKKKQLDWSDEFEGQAESLRVYWRC